MGVPEGYIQGMVHRVPQRGLASIAQGRRGRAGMQPSALPVKHRSSDRGDACVCKLMGVVGSVAPDCEACDLRGIDYFVCCFLLRSLMRELVLCVRPYAT